MAVKLRKRVNKDGSTTLYLDIFHQGKRQYEFLTSLKLVKESNLKDRNNNKQNLELAKAIALKRNHELGAGEYGIATMTGKKTDVLFWFSAYVEKYNKKDKRMLIGALNHFKNFLSGKSIKGLTFSNLDELLVSEFQDYLRERGTGEGPSSYFKRFKRMIKYACRQKVITVNPAAHVATITGTSKRKDTLTKEEIELLARTPTNGTEIKRAFLFSCVTGLRWVDVYSLKWLNININGKTLTLTQTKTGSDVLIHLNKTALEILGSPGIGKEKVFNLPTANAANKTLKGWVERAGIQKKITWHNARHSFGTNLVFNGADVTTASSLLGHSSLKHTQRYVKAARELKNKATDTLNFQLGEL